MNWQQQPVHFVLADDEAHLYRIRISSHLHLLDKISLWLSEDEKVRGSKYHQLKDRQRFTVSRGLQRYILAQYTSKQASDLQFTLGDNKKPLIAGSTLQYNITHARDYILLAVSNGQIGADVEHIDPAFNFSDILPAHFSPQEIAFIAQQDSQLRFYRLWTRKEAFLKATGQGLGEHLIDTSSMDGSWTLPENVTSHGQNWQLATLEVDDNHLGSIACASSVRSVVYFDFELQGVNL